MVVGQEWWWGDHHTHLEKVCERIEVETKLLQDWLIDHAANCTAALYKQIDREREVSGGGDLEKIT